MWLQMPRGCESISIEQQNFVVEARDDDGNGYCRVPNHFVPRVLRINGFRRADPPAGAPDDLPLPDPLRDGAIADLTKTVEAQKRQIETTTSDLNAAVAALKGANTAKSALAAENANLKRRVSELEEQLADAKDAAK